MSALASAAWDQRWKPKAGSPRAPRDRSLPCDDFYADWARVNFGPEAADSFARLVTEIDGRVPLATLDGCPVGPLDAETTPWATIATGFAFVDALENLRPAVRGAGNLDRFDYWLNTFLYYRSLAQVRCALGAKAAPEEITRLWSTAGGGDRRTGLDLRPRRPGADGPRRATSRAGSFHDGHRDGGGAGMD